MRFRFIPLLSCVAFAILMTGCGGSGSKGSGPTPTPTPSPGGPPSQGITAVNHVVIMIQENRSFDHYFGQMTAYRAANGYPISGSPATIEDESAGSFSNFSPVTGANITVYHSGSVC